MIEDTLSPYRNADPDGDESNYCGPASSEIAIQDRIELLRSALDMRECAKEIIFKAIAHEEAAYKGKNRRANLAGISALLKLLMSMEGIERASESDIDLSLPVDTEKAIDLLIEMRGKGKLKSIQGNDLANLVSKRTDYVKLKEIASILDTIKAQRNTQQLDMDFEITKTEDLLNV